MSLCDRCFAPGQCCKRIQFYSGTEMTLWLDEPLEPQLRAMLHADDRDRPMPFRSIDGTVRELRDEETGRPYGTMTFSCVNLTPDGRCGDYENRPWLCRTFEPGSDRLCVHYRGAEAGEG